MQLSRELFDKLKESVPFFSNFSDGELLALLKLSAREVFQDEEIIFKEGTRGDKMYIIMAGTVRISKYLGNKKEEVLAKLQSGACFGEMGVIDQSPRSARATVEGGEALILVIKESLLKESNVMLAYKLYKNFSVMLAQRLRETNNKLSDVSQEDTSASAQLKDLVKKRMEQGQSLQGVNLKGADLNGVYLHNANLEKAILINSSMNEAKMKQANLTGAKMVNTSLNGADFNQANLSGADFTGSNFENANFEGCVFSGCTFDGAELSKADMEKIKVIAASPKKAAPKKPVPKKQS